MPLFSIQRKVRLRIEKIQGDFLWGGRALEKEITPNEVVDCVRGQEEGGLVVKCLSLLNEVLLCKFFLIDKENNIKQKEETPN